MLVLDLDSQCNASLILQGGQGWLEAKKANRTISDYFFDMFDETAGAPREYLVHGVGDIRDTAGKAPRLSLLPGSLMLEDVQGELYVKEARQAKDPDVVASRVRGRLMRLLRRFEGSYDLVVLDCAPGLSFAALAALKTADLVLVPFRPDYVSQMAVDRVALLIEEKRNIDDLREIGIEQRRYVCVANGSRGTSRDRNIIDEIGLDHPMLETQLPHSDGIANAFDWETGRKTMEEKYGNGVAAIRALYDELQPLMSQQLAAE